MSNPMTIKEESKNDTCSASVVVLAAALVTPAVADLVELAGGGPVALPSAAELIVELGSD